MVLLVVDAYKGWQSQTTECLVLAELTSPHLVVALNKADMFDENEREQQLAIAERKVRERLKSTRFADAPVVGVAACVGGEKVAAAGGSDDTAKNSAAQTTSSSQNETFQIELLVKLLKEKLPRPRRNTGGPFYFSIDHCFPIRGRGTVLTGTVLSGSTSVNESLEFPTLVLERKVKSIQMFKRQVQTIQQGDRAGICVSSLDAKLLERGIAASPGAVQLWKGAIAVVRKVKYYTAGSLKCGAKFHISVGHTTVMATVTFWGARELAERARNSNKVLSSSSLSERPKTPSGKKGGKAELTSSSLGGDADMAGLPRIEYDFDQDFVQQDEVLDSLENGSRPASSKASNEPLLHWALLDFQTPVHCPVHSLVIGSRLDTTVDNATGSTSSCRLAFSGRLIQNVDPADAVTKIRLYTSKERRGEISKLGEPYRRSDDDKVVRYEVFGSDLFKKETNMKQFIGMKLETEKGELGEIKGTYGTSGKFRVFFPGGTEAKEGDALILKFKRFANDPEKAMRQDVQLPSARAGTRIELQKKKSKKKAEEKGVNRVGEVASLKGDPLENDKHPVAIISGFFAPEVNVKEKAGIAVVIPSTGDEGTIVGPFGKAGKCKVSFEQGTSAEVGAKAELKL